MKLETTFTLLQFLGVFPVVLEKNIFFAKNRSQPRLRKLLICCTIGQFALTASRLNRIVLMMSAAPPDMVLTMVITGFYQLSDTVTMLLPLINMKHFHKCIQLGRKVMASSGGRLPKCSRAFLNFLFQNIQCILIIAQFNFLLTRLGIHRSKYQTALLALEICNCFIVSTTVNYTFLTVLSIASMSYNQINQRLSKLSNGKLEKNVTSEKIENLRRKHWKTGNLLVQASRAFSFNVFLFCSTTFVKMTFLVYLLCVTPEIWSSEFADNPKTFIALQLTLYSICGLLIDFVILCSACQQILDEGNKTPVILYRILRKRSDTSENSTILEIRKFLVNIRSRNITLNGWDFFYVSKAIFYGVVSQIVSYIILLIQFKIFQ